MFHSSFLRQFLPLFLSFVSLPSTTSAEGISLPNLRLPDHLPTNFAHIFPEAVQNISDPATTFGLNIAVPLPTYNFLKSKPNYLDAAADFMKTSLPSVLAQFNVPADQIAEKTEKSMPVLLEFLREMHSDVTPALTPRGLAYRRSLWSKIGGILGDIGCGVAGAVVGPASFLFFSAEFNVLNPGPGVGLTDHQQFFVFPVHGDIATSAPVQIYYRATRPLGFNNAETVGTTFNKKWYTYYPNSPFRSDPNFEWLMQKVILHEFQHVVQYRAYGYNLIRYGDKYGFEVCKDGYNNMFLENEARSKESAADPLLIDPTGKRFFDAWAAHGLRGSLGFPTKVAWSVVDGGVLELRFQYGVLQIQGGASWRTFTHEEIGARGFTNCRSDLRCPRPHKRAQCQNCPTEPDGPGGCNQAELDQQNLECKEGKQKWRNLNSRPFQPI